MLSLQSNKINGIWNIILCAVSGISNAFRHCQQQELARSLIHELCEFQIVFSFIIANIFFSLHVVNYDHRHSHTYIDVYVCLLKEMKFQTKFQRTFCICPEQKISIKMKKHKMVPKELLQTQLAINLR